MKALRRIGLLLVLLIAIVGCTTPKDEKNPLEEAFVSLFSGIDTENVTGDLNFITDVDGISIEYVSGMNEVITNEGVVSRQLEDTAVEVIVILSNEDKEVIKKVTFVVIKEDFASLYAQVFAGFNRQFVTEDLALVNNVQGYDVTYESSKPHILSSDGKVTRQDDDADLSLDVTLSKGSVVSTQSFNVFVIKREKSNAELAFEKTYKGATVIVTSENLVLPTKVDGVTVTYSSSNPSILSNTGVVVRGEEDREVMLTITFSDETSTFTKMIPVQITADRRLKIERVFQNLFTTNLNQVTTNLNFPAEVENVQITYTSSKEGVLSNVGEVVRGAADVEVTLQLQLTYMGIVEEKTIQIVVLKKEASKYASYYPNPSEMRFLEDELEDTFTKGISPVGTSNVLVIPVAFTDYSISQNDLNRLETALFGTGEATGWESVRSYYDKASYGKFDFDGDILPVFQTGKTASYYSNRYESGIDADYEIIQAALKHYDSQIDYSDYDLDNDGYIDGIYFIYATDVFYDDGGSSANDVDLWWAYVYQYYTDDVELYDGVEANYYMWAGFDFMDEPLVYDDYNDEYININASTYIHETGHMLGMDDYYDYEEGNGPEGGLGGADMMDYTVGDHNPFSKIMMNWVNPYVVRGESTTVKIRPFESSGDAILVTSNWKNSYFEEYFLIDFYKPTGLNAAHAGFNGLYDVSGIRIIHVTAELTNDIDNSYSVHKYNNSYTSRKLLTPIEADFNNSIQNTRIAENSDLFQAGKTFGVNNQYRLSTGSLVNFTIKVVSISATEAVIEIQYH